MKLSYSYIEPVAYSYLFSNVNRKGYLICYLAFNLLIKDVICISLEYYWYLGWELWWGGVGERGGDEETGARPQQQHW